ncbi:hypothetical protein NO932_11750 [Pelagibacterium sp. 26DY04]|uniref:hypothetical protein n=1 Tax=Pelagibacterium sp. 26DY04 TaxID=2967130 RepID=UPI0028150B2B|nr:hypothetical protein [Pelagibacterium sp. 26DY04]WMT85602.1 hypothetical protein NO932_11750 [Pelagibacterium sp. 26DY04]
MAWELATSILGRLLDWRGGIVYDADFRECETEPKKWPAIWLHATIYNRTPAPIYTSHFEAEGDEFLAIHIGRPEKPQIASSRVGNSITFPERRIEPQEKLSLDFLLYPNWQRLDMELPQPQSGLSGQSAGMVATFHTRLRLDSKASMRLPNATERAYSIDRETISAKAKTAESMAGKTALSHWMSDSTDPS